MNARPYLSLSMPGSGAGDSRLTCAGSELLLEYEYRSDGRDFIGRLRFWGVAAYRFRNEAHSRGFIPTSYDAVVEVIDSLWFEDVMKGVSEGVSGAKAKKHFALFLSSNGYFEVIADTVELLAPADGFLE